MPFHELFEQSDYSEFKTCYNFASFEVFLTQYPITLEAWQQLLQNYPDSEQVRYFFIAPMLEKILGYPPTSMDDLEQAWNRIHEYIWPSEAWLFLFRFACFVKQEIDFIDRFGADNLRLLSTNLTVLLKAFHGTDEAMRNRLISKIEPDNIDLSSITSLEGLIKHLNNSLQSEFFNKVGINLLINYARLRSNSTNEENHPYLFKQDMTVEKIRQFVFSFTLINTINAFKNKALRLDIFRRLPKEALTEAIYSCYELNKVLQLFNIQDRLELSQTILKDTIANIEFNPYNLKDTLENIHSNHRIAWLADVLTWDKLASMKKDRYWNEFKRLFTNQHWAEIRTHLYPDEELTAHFTLKLIRAKLNNHSSTMYNFSMRQEIPRELQQSYLLVHMTTYFMKKEIIASPPVMEIVDIMGRSHNRELKQSQALDQIRAIGKATHEALSNPENPYRPLYTNKGLAFFKALSSEEDMNEVFSPRALR